MVRMKDQIQATLIDVSSLLHNTSDGGPCAHVRSAKRGISDCRLLLSWRDINADGVQLPTLSLLAAQQVSEPPRA